MEKDQARLLEDLEVGQTHEGTVKRIQDFGAFVDLGGVEGLLHISQLSWDRVGHPSEVLQEGQTITVRIEKINKETGKIGLGYRDLLEHPWANALEQFPVDSVVRGVVTRVTKFGAFVRLAPGIEGLVHISELSESHVQSVSDVVQEGDNVKVKVLRVDTDAQRIALSMKGADQGDDARISEDSNQDTDVAEKIRASNPMAQITVHFDGRDLTDEEMLLFLDYLAETYRGSGDGVGLKIVDGKTLQPEAAEVSS